MNSKTMMALYYAFMMKEFLTVVCTFLIVHHFPKRPRQFATIDFSSTLDKMAIYGKSRADFVRFERQNVYSLKAVRSKQLKTTISVIFSQLSD